MDLGRVITDLRQERDRVEEAILSLERLSGVTQKKRRGRPPAWLKKIVSPQKKRGRPLGSKNKKTGGAEAIGLGQNKD